MATRTLLAVLVALIPGVVTWWLGRSIIRQTDSPGFAERLLAHRIRLIYVWLFSVIVGATLAPDLGLMVVVIALLAWLVGSFPSRRRIFNEEWTLPEFLVDRLRIAIGGFGFWIAIMMAPIILTKFGPWSIYFLLPLLIVWGLAYQPLLAIALDAEPITDPVMEAHFRAVFEKSSAPAASAKAIGPRRGRWANAIAIPRGAASAVLISRTLLKEMEPLETAAIFAHEVAHLEQYNQRGMGFRRALFFILVPLLATVPQLLLMTDEQSNLIFSLVWPIVFAIAMFFSMVQRQRYETEADLRALDLGAHPETLISALTKLHDMNRVPQRFDAKVEARMTHPSLASRVAAIRKKAGLEEVESSAAVALPLAIRGRRRGAFVVIDPDQLSLLGRAGSDDLGVPELLAQAKKITSFPLSSIRSATVRYGITGPLIQLTPLRGRSRLIPIDAGSVAAAQQTLSAVEPSFATKATETIAHTDDRKRRLLAVATAIFALMPGISIISFFAAVFAAIKPGLLPFSAMTGSIIASLAFVPRSAQSEVAVLTWTAAAGLALVFVLSLSFRLLHLEENDRYLKATLIIFALLAALSAAPYLFSLRSADVAAALFMTARSKTSLIVSLAAIAAALSFSKRRVQAVAMVAIAVMLSLLGTRTFVDALSPDQLLAHAKVRPSSLQLTKLTTVAAPGHWQSVELSPDASAYLLMRWPDDYRPGNQNQHYLAGSVSDGQQLRWEGMFATFADADTLFRTRSEASRLIIETVSLSSSDTDTPWRVELPALSYAVARLNNDKSWVIDGNLPGTNRRRRFAGSVNSSRWQEGEVESDATVQPLALVPHMDENSSLSMIFMTLLGHAASYDLWQLDREKPKVVASTVLEARLVEPLDRGALYALVGYDGTDSHVATVDPATGKITPRAFAPGDSLITAFDGETILASASRQGDVAVMNVGSRQRLVLSHPDEWIGDLALRPGRLAVLRNSGRSTTIDLYDTRLLTAD